jgi:hypothetical protein
VTYLFKARTVETEKQPVVASGSGTTFVSRQRLGKHLPAARDTHAKIDVLLETGSSTQSEQRGYNEGKWGNRISFVKEVGREPPEDT